MFGAKSIVELILRGKDEASGAFDAVSGKVGGLTSLLGKGLAIGAGAAVAGVAALGGAAIKLAQDAEPIAGISSAFNALTSDVEGGSAAMLAALQQSSAGFVSNTELMKSFNMATQLVSDDFAQQLPGAMEALGKVSAATGEDMGFLLDSLVRGVGRLSPMILDNLGIQVDLNGAYETYAASVGKSVDELTKAEQQTALTNQVMEKLAANTADMAGPQGGFTQFQVAMTNLKDTVGVALLPVFQPLLGMLTDMATNVLPPVAAWLGENIPAAMEAVSGWWNSTLQPALAQFGGVLNGELGPGLELVRSALADALPLAMSVVSAFWNDYLLPVFTALWGIIQDPILPLLGDLFTWIGTQLPVAIGFLQTAWDTVLHPALLTLSGFMTETLIPALGDLFAWIGENLPQALQILGTWIGDVLLPKVQELWDVWVNVVWPAISQALSDAWNNVILPALQAFWDFLTNTVIPKVQELWDQWVNVWWPAISTALENAWTIIKTVWEELGRWINDNIVPWVEFLHEKWVEEVWPAIQSVIETVWGIIQPIWESFREYLEDTLPPALEGFRTVMEAVMSAIQIAIQPVKDLWDRLVEAVTNFWDWISSHTFEFSIHIPDLPDWAVPGSPLPIHTAWENFGDYMRTANFAPQVNLAQVAPLAGVGGQVPTLAAGGGGGNTMNIYVQDASTGEQLLALVRELQRSSTVTVRQS